MWTAFLQLLGEGLQQQAFGQVQGLNQFQLANQQVGSNQALAGTQGASNLSQLPLSFLQANLAAGGQASNTQFAAAGVNQGNAQLATSPFLEALGAAGQFAGAIRPQGVS